MKFFALAFVLMTASAFAEVPEIISKYTTCAELTASVKNYGSVIVARKFLGKVRERVQVYAEKTCDSDERKVRGDFKTSDTKNCSVGVYCEYIPVYVPSYDSGYSSSSSSSYDSSYSSSSSSSSSDYGSSSSSSSSYNPPSSSEHGSSYNPPSSGTHGSHYCPSCAF